MATKPILKLYDQNDTYMSPAGTLLDAAAVLGQWPAAARFAHVVETDPSGETMLSFDGLSKMCGIFDVDRSGLTDAEAVEALAEAIYQQRLASEGDPAESTPEERIAAALELANTINLPTVNDDDHDAE